MKSKIYEALLLILDLCGVEFFSFLFMKYRMNSKKKIKKKLYKKQAKLFAKIMIIISGLIIIFLLG